MKKLFLFAVIVCVFSISAMSDQITRNEYLTCSGQHDSTWHGYTVLLKKLSNGKIMGVLWKYKMFSKNTYTLPFQLDAKVSTDYKAVTYSNDEHGISFTVYKDSYSGVLVAEAYHRSYSGSSELLCDKMNAKSFYFWYVDPKRNARDTNLTNVTALYHLD